MELNLRIGASCYGSDGTKLGTLHRIVIDEQDDRVTHLVIDPGLLEAGNLLAPGGWEKPRDIVVPADILMSADDEAIHLNCTKDAFKAMPQFEVEHFTGVGAGWTPPAGYRIEEFLTFASSAWGLGGGAYVPPADVTRQEGPTEHEITVGTPVWRLEPSEKELGKVVRVLTDPDTLAVTALVVRHGMIRREDVVLPIRYVTDVQDDQIFVDIADELWEKLERYAPETH